MLDRIFSRMAALLAKKVSEMARQTVIQLNRNARPRYERVGVSQVSGDVGRDPVWSAIRYSGWCVQNGPRVRRRHTRNISQEDDRLWLQKL